MAKYFGTLKLYSAGALLNAIFSSGNDVCDTDSRRRKPFCCDNTRQRSFRAVWHATHSFACIWPVMSLHPFTKASFQLALYVPSTGSCITSSLQLQSFLAAVSVGSPWKKLYMSLLRFPSRHCCKKALYQGSRHLMTSDKGQKERIDPGPVSQNMDKAFRARPGGTSKGLLQRYVPDTGCSCQKSPHITVFTPPNERFFPSGLFLYVPCVRMAFVTT